MPTVAFHTLGCKVNHYETEAMMDLFKKADYKIVDFDKKADYYIINSCTVTNEAARKSRQFARRAKRRNTEGKVALVGCYSQVSPEEVKKVEEIDYILGTEGKKDIVELLEKSSKNEKDTIQYNKANKILKDISRFKDIVDYEELKVAEVQETTRAYVKIEEGCNQFCSYCIIPYARGTVRSRKMEAVIEEVKTHLKTGVKEIILTGIHLGAYGLNWGNDYALVELIEKLLEVDDEYRIRLSSIEVTEINDRLLDLMADEPQLCPHLHLPLQSGSAKILKKMNRPYTKVEFKNAVDKVRSKLPGATLTTDVIVGFPGEEEENFEESFRFIKDIGFSRLHVFPYSKREGTPAAKMKDQISGDTKKEYSQRLRDLNEELMLAYQKKHIGQIRQVIIEEKRDYQTNLLTGFTDNYIKVLIDDDDCYMNKLVDVKLTDSYNYENATGKIVKKKEF